MKVSDPVRIVVSFPSVELEIGEVERLLRHLDGLWVGLAQMAAYATPGLRPATRSRVAAPVMEASSPHRPYAVTLSVAGMPPPTPLAWQLLHRALTDPPGWIEPWVRGRRTTWSEDLREARDRLLSAAVQPRTTARVATGLGEPIDLVDPLARLQRRIDRDLARIATIGGPASVGTVAARRPDRPAPSIPHRRI